MNNIDKNKKMRSAETKDNAITREQLNDTFMEGTIDEKIDNRKRKDSY